MIKKYSIFLRDLYQICIKHTHIPIPLGIARWVVDFLTNRKQRVKLANDCYSEWGHTLAGVPQGTKLRPWLFLLMINDLKFATASKWKYVDDTSVAEIVKKGNCSTIQSVKISCS